MKFFHVTVRVPALLDCSSRFSTNLDTFFRVNHSVNWQFYYYKLIQCCKLVSLLYKHVSLLWLHTTLDLSRNIWDIYFTAKDCLALMQEGTELTKLKPNGRLYRRYYWLDNDLSEIRWMPTSKSYNKAKSK